MDKKNNLRYWVGGYFDDGKWIEPVVTVEKKFKDTKSKKDNWVQLEQYHL